MLPVVAINYPLVINEANHPVRGKSQGIDRDQHADVVAALPRHLASLNLQKRDLPDPCPLRQCDPLLQTIQILVW